MNFREPNELKDYLDELVERFNRPEFIPHDPVSIPHRFSRQEDVEISALFAAILAWGQRKTILSKMDELLRRMDTAPFAFITQHNDKDLQRLEGFVHRTFNDTDVLYFIHFLRSLYREGENLETAFFPETDPKPDAVYHGLRRFRERFVSSEHFPIRSGKHLSSPLKGSACKRLNMFLRWMVRKDDAGVDFGLWNSIRPSQLICPCDVHVERQARKLGLISRPKPDWTMAEELTANLRLLDPVDPVKYDFALFGLGVEKVIL